MSPLIHFPNSKPVVEEINLSLHSLPKDKNLHIVLLSDLHIRKNTNLESIFSITKSLSPTLLFLLGDYFYSYKRQKVMEFFHHLRKINPPLGKFAVLGNRDYAEFLPPLFKSAGIYLLKDSFVPLRYNSLTLTIGGIDFATKNIANFLSSLPKADLTILLSHKPDVIFSPGEWHKVQLVVSGHTHGGQIRLPLLGAIFTKSKLPNKYSSGLIEFPGLKLYITRGIGMSKFPLRFACPSEITSLKIKSGDGNE
ncbi:metallophosphoesterase [bacterium]|nr:metallophosphoesterase [bacterium]